MSVGPKESVKVVILGDTGVGKSSLALRFVTNEFRPYSESTIGASFMSKTVTIQDDAPVEEQADGAKKKKRLLVQRKPRSVDFNIWDTAGQEKYFALAPMYYRGAGAAVLVYDMCSHASFDTLRKWVDELRRNGPPEIVMAVCGNKSDLSKHRQIEREVAQEYSDSIGAFYIETSARDGINVQELFCEVGKRVPSVVDDTATEVENRLGKVNLGGNVEESRTWFSWSRC